MLMKYGYLIVRSLGAKLQEFPQREIPSTHLSASFDDVKGYFDSLYDNKPTWTQWQHNTHLGAFVMLYLWLNLKNKAVNMSNNVQTGK